VRRSDVGSRRCALGATVVGMVRDRAADLVRRWCLSAGRRVRPSWDVDAGVRTSDLVAEALHNVGSVLRASLRGLTLASSEVFLCERRVEIRGGRHVYVGRGVLLESDVAFYARGGGEMRIGPSSVIGRGTIIELASSLRQLGGDFRMGTRSSLADNCYVGCAGGVTIGAGVLIGQFVSIHSENHLFRDTGRSIREQGVTRGEIRIGDGCWVGAGSRILAGVTIGDHAVIAAGSVVTRDVAAGQVVAGVPARVIDDLASTRRRGFDTESPTQ